MAKGKFDDVFDLTNLTGVEAAQFQDLLAKVRSAPFGAQVAAAPIGTILEEWNASLMKMAQANEAVVEQIAFRLPTKKPGRLGLTAEFRLPGVNSLPFVEILPDFTLEASGPDTAPATPEAAEPDAPTEADWEEVRRRALEIVGANLLDSPERHLAYIRERIAGAASRDV
jgi:hypothetical protein